MKPNGFPHPILVLGDDLSSVSDVNPCRKMGGGCPSLKKDRHPPSPVPDAGKSNPTMKDKDVIMYPKGEFNNTRKVDTGDVAIEVFTPRREDFRSL